jgi:hypothetical protein
MLKVKPKDFVVRWAEPSDWFLLRAKLKGFVVLGGSLTLGVL